MQPVFSIHPSGLNHKDVESPQPVDRMRRAMVFGPIASGINSILGDRNQWQSDLPPNFQTAEMGPAQMLLTASNDLSYAVAFRHLGLNDRWLFHNRDRLQNFSLQEIVTSPGALNSVSMFLQIASRFEKNNLEYLVKEMLKGYPVPIIAPDTLYIDRAIFGNDGRRLNPRDYIGRYVTIIPCEYYDETGGYQTNLMGGKKFGAYIFDVKAERDRLPGSSHFGDANPALYRELGVHVNYPNRPFFQIGGDGADNLRRDLNRVPSFRYVLDVRSMSNDLWDPGKSFNLIQSVE